MPVRAGDRLAGERARVDDIFRLQVKMEILLGTNLLPVPHDVDINDVIIIGRIPRMVAKEFRRIVRHELAVESLSEFRKQFPERACVAGIAGGLYKLPLIIHDDRGVMRGKECRHRARITVD